MYLRISLTFLYIASFSEYVNCSNTLNIYGSSFPNQNTHAGSITSLSCELPLKILGNPIYICGTDGQWKGTGICRKFVLHLYILSFMLISWNASLVTVRFINHHNYLINFS